MNFRTSENGRRVEAIVDVTPLIDVVFLLLIFFMITTTFVNSPGIEVELPKATNSEQPLHPNDIVIAIGPDGDVIFNHKQVSLDELSALLEGKFTEMTDATVIVQADEEVFHGLVVKVMDLAKAAGFTKLAIATQQD